MNGFISNITLFYDKNNVIFDWNPFKFDLMLHNLIKVECVLILKKIFAKVWIQFIKLNRIQKFTGNTDLRKQNYLKRISVNIDLFLTQWNYTDFEFINSTKILLNMYSLFTFVKKRERSLIFYKLKKSCFLNNI